MPETESAETPLLIYDGDCAFCLWWARYWQRGSAGRLRIAPFQQVASDYPHIPVQEFCRAAQYIDADGVRSSAAEASLRAASAARGKGMWLSAYRRVPGFAALAEGVYAFIARHRGVCYGLTIALWGLRPEPPRFDLVCELFLRALGLIYVAALTSFAVQSLGLIGSNGILPVSDHLARITERHGSAAYLRYPTAFWLNASDLALQAVAWGGALIALLLVIDVWRDARGRRALLLLLFALYLSLFHAGQVFMIYQWDLLLLETGFLALFLTSGSVLAVWLLRWLLFRFMFLSGVVKLASGDTSWADLTVLTRYFETQPLPTPLAWYAHQLPDTALVAAAGLMFAIELVLPFFIFLPRRPRCLAASAFIAFQLAIIATGNYGFFNLLTIALCLLLFDDRAIGGWLPGKWRPTCTRRRAKRTPTTLASSVTAIFAVVVVLAGGGQIYAAATRNEPPVLLAKLAELSAPLRIVNQYGAFAEIITERQEIVVEGSLDGQTWREYEFKYKPGDVAAAPGFNLPHQPRIDWQMWFAALGNESRNWFPDFLQRLLAASPDVLALLANDPFEGAKPKAVRAVIYEYRFASPEQRAQGLWWERRQTGLYYPAMTAQPAGQNAPGASTLIDSIMQFTPQR